MVTGGISTSARDPSWFSTTTGPGVQCPAVVSVRQQVPIRPSSIYNCSNTSELQNHWPSRYHCHTAST